MREIKIRRLTLGSLSNGVGQNYQSLNCYVWNSYGPVVMGRPCPQVGPVEIIDKKDPGNHKV